MSNDKNHLIEGDFKYQKLKQMSCYQKDALSKTLFQYYVFWDISSLPKFISKLVKTKNFKYKYLEKYIVIG